MSVCFTGGSYHAHNRYSPFPGHPRFSFCEVRFVFPCYCAMLGSLETVCIEAVVALVTEHDARARHVERKRVRLVPVSQSRSGNARRRASTRRARKRVAKRHRYLGDHRVIVLRGERRETPSTRRNTHGRRASPSRPPGGAPNAPCERWWVGEGRPAHTQVSRVLAPLKI